MLLLFEFQEIQDNITPAPHLFSALAALDRLVVLYT